MNLYFTPKYFLYFSIFCICTFSAIGFSQEQEIDSLDQYSFEELDQKFLKVFYENPKLAKVYANYSFELAEKANSPRKKVLALINLATAFNATSEYEISISYIDRAISLATKTFKGQELEAATYHTKGIFFFQRSDYETAFENYTKAYDFYEDSSQELTKNSISHNIALIKNALDDHAGALDILKTNYNNFLDTPISERNTKFSSSFYINTLYALVDVYIKLSDDDETNKAQLLDSATFYNKEGYKETIRTNHPSAISFHTQRGILSYEREQYKVALHELDASIEKIKQSSFKELFTSAYYYKAMSFKKLAEIDSAIVYFQKMDSVSQKNNINYPMLQRAYHELVEIFKERKDRDNAYKYLDLYNENDRINERTTGTVRKDIHEKFDLIRLKSEIDALNKTQSNSLVLIGVLIACLGIFFLFYRRQKVKNKVAFEKLVTQLETKKTHTITVQKPKTSVVIDDEKVIQVLKELEKFERKEGFRNKNCNLEFVAKKVKTNKTYLSKIIHEHKQVKFIDYIRNLRINYALERLKDDVVFRSYDLKSIAEESGFKSPDMFSRAFVKNTGIYPSYYIKNINKINS
ncbi:MAG: helix-turn-helix domain-containing protein [Bacteroidota bacterium]